MPFGYHAVRTENTGNGSASDDFERVPTEHVGECAGLNNLDSPRPMGDPDLAGVRVDQDRDTGGELGGTPYDVRPRERHASALDSVAEDHYRASVQSVDVLGDENSGQQFPCNDPVHEHAAPDCGWVPEDERAETVACEDDHRRDDLVGDIDGRHGISPVSSRSHRRSRGLAVSSVLSPIA